MSQKKKPIQDVDTEMFYGLGSRLDENQLEFKNAIFDDKYKIVCSNSCAGSGKTTIALMCARLLIATGKYDAASYIFSVPNDNNTNGFIPGDITAKEMPYFSRIFSILLKMNEDPYTSIKQLVPQKDGKPNVDAGWLNCVSDTYLRGCTIGDINSQIVIIDEAENFYFDKLKMVLTRITDDSKVILIGHSGQCDLLNHPERSGFEPYLEHFAKKDWCKVVNLTHDYRGEISAYADELYLK